jgi:hypothetical protein
MARLYGKLKISRWRDDNWLKLPTDCQWLYMFLLAQPTTDTAGVFPIQLTKWAKASPDMTVERVKTAAKRLDDAGWIVADHDTEEGLISSLVADDDAGGLVFIGALNRALQAQSPLLRRRLLHEVLELDREFNDREQKLVDELADSLDTSPSPVPITATQAFDRSSKTDQRPFEDSWKTVP